MTPPQSSRDSARNSDNVISSSTPVAHIAIILLLMAAHIAVGALTSVASSDTNRDIFYAQQIASGQSFPLTGPDINGVLHLGPLWYYMLAPILWIIPNAAAVTSLMALLSALQFPMAYVLAKRFSGSSRGILFPLLLALPTWTVVSLGSMTHTIIVVSSLLAGVLIADRYRARPTWQRATGIGLALTFMLTAHPTLVLPAGFLLVWAAMKTPKPGLWIGHGALALLPVVASLAPMAYEQSLHSFHDVDSTSHYAQTQWSMPSLLSGANLVYSTIIYAPRYLTHFWLRESSAVEAWLMSAYTAVFLLSSIGLTLRLRRDRSCRGLVLGLSTLLLADAVFLCAVRPVMPPWMVYALCPMIAATCAIGLEYLWSQRLMRIVIGLLLLITTSWTASIYATLIPGPADHTEIKPSTGKHGLLDIREYEESELHYHLARIPFYDVFSLGIDLCHPVTLFGHYAYLVDYTFAVGAAQNCGTTEFIEFGGVPKPDRKQIVGLDKDAWAALEMKPERWLSRIGLATPAAVWHSPQSFVPVAPYMTNWPRHLRTEVKEFTVSGDAPNRQAVLVAQRAHRYNSFEVVAAKADGELVSPKYSDTTTAVYRATDPRPERIVHWEFSIRAVPEYVDVLAIDNNNE